MFPIRIQINKRTLRMKLHYFLYMGGVASVQGFAPTIAKQLGYSPMVVGSVFTYLSMLSFFVKPIVGIIVDKFRVKRIMFLAFVLLCGLTAFSIKFVPKIPTEAVANLSCGATTVMNVCSNDDDRLSQCDDSLFKLVKYSAEPIECQLRCEQNKSFRDEIYRSWNIVDHNIDINPNITYKNDEFEDLDVTLIIYATDQVEQNNVGFQVKSVHIMKTQVAFPVCQRPVSTRCKINCSNDVVVELATVQKFEGSVFGLHQFWKYLTVMSLFWISQAITWSLQDPICFDILGDKPEDFGKQRCWGSISWGIFSVFGGALVDYFSYSDYEKNYVPVYYLCLVIILWDFALAYKIEVTETIGSKNTFSDVFKLITNMNVIVYLIWIVVMGICTTMPWNYLFWYMEDLTQKYHSDKQSWTKTLQGLAIGIQCIGGELPLLFFSGSICTL
ncbi:major facilitator superfamily domain-containing protein 6 isoform X2 [Acyrthosiphon pisum]|uniref:Major facilitator superfamily associated domain-containing protein n=1 Tax=Acyrthosiphon pisum TaxID=7029 RepID=A0A8R2JSU6_ACYPI|nr:major facilitator superfamily domain-containing protein 6 isoform X2 [Acyrthosiphon pisum]